MEGKRQPLVIGIGGVSNGGKTTLSTSLFERLQNRGIKTYLINQDKYFKKEEDVPMHPSGEYRIWDDLVAIDMIEMMKEIRQQVRDLQNVDGAVLIIEGFLIFNDRELNSLFSRRYLLTLPKEEALRRRLTRVYEPPDTPNIFNDHVWPMYELYYNTIMEDKVDFTEFDGRLSPEKISDKVFSETLSLLS